ncbi:MAG: transglutaminase domain-containing protein [Planctomycetes bacterium]|nr:transglutaminase domain-containing protein [Planctomycetota bacterium]
MRRLAMAALVLVTATAVRAGGEPAVQYMAVFMDNAKVGHQRTARRVDGGRVIHDVTMEMTFNVYGIMVALRMENRYVETSGGEPVEFVSIMEAGPLGRTVRRGTIADGQMHVTVEEKGSARQRTLPFPVGALLPEGARLRCLAEGFKEGAAYSVAVFDPQSLKPMTADVTVGPTAPTVLIGRTVRAAEIVNRIRTATGTVQTVDHVTADGTVVRSSTSVLGRTLRLVACDEAFATAANAAVELRDAGSVPSPRPLPEARRSVRAAFTLTPADGAALVLPDTGEQTVEVRPDGTVVVRVALAEAPRALRPYTGDDAAVRAMLGAGEHVQSDHPRMAAQARQIAEKIPDAGAAAKAIEAWVSNHITDKVLGVPYASALATLASGQGDCTEHAVLTAALCRAAGIPCRVVMGVVYTDDFEGQTHCFIGHAWNQAYIGGRWVGLDAAIGADAARIALAAGNGDPLDFIGMTQSLGRFTITAAEVGAAGE